MWNSKMAAQWRRKDEPLNAANSDCLANTNPNELILSRGDVADVEGDTDSCMDHSILAIFEDAITGLDNKSEVEEESETLLSALTEMLDSVEDDGDTLSPFDTLPDTKLLLHPDCRDSSVTVPLAERLRRRSKTSTATFTVKSGGEKEDEKKIERNSLPLRFENTKAENEVEVFTSASLVNLVKLMHPYCLKLHVDEGNNLTKKHLLFSQGEVWRYERPTEESDEEINVVSDDEAHVEKTKEADHGDEKAHNIKVLKSVLQKGNSSKEKKRVSFGPVQVTSFDESVEKGLNQQILTTGQTSETVSLPINGADAIENPSGSAPESQTPFSTTNSKKAEVLRPKGETKPKSLSLQQYRQLRQKRKPLVEKQGNYTTKWPSVSEPPKELPPILCLQGQNGCRPKTAQHYPDDGTKISPGHLHKPGHKTLSHHPSPPSTQLHHSCLKRRRSESRNISPASPLADVLANTDIIVAGNKNSPLKKPTLCSSDPPNPVLLPMPVSGKVSPPTHQSLSQPEVDTDSNLQSPRHLQKIQNHSSPVFPQSQVKSLSEPKLQVLLPNHAITTPPQEIKDKFTGIASDISPRSPELCPPTIQTESASNLQHQTGSVSPSKETTLEPKALQSPLQDPLRQIQCPCSTAFCVQPSSVDDPNPLRATLPGVPPSISPHKEPASTHPCGFRGQNETEQSGIEASDLTSLLEQFEETQAKEENGCENELKPKNVSATPALNLQTPEDLDLHSSPYTGSETTSRLPLEHLSTLKNPRNTTDLQMLEHVDIPEPLTTEIILGTQDQPARRKTLPCKAIQIIDPRPLPSRKSYASPSDAPAATHNSSYTLSSVTSDHDYCGPVDRSLTVATHRSRAKSSLLKDVCKTTGDTQLRLDDSNPAAECKTRTSHGPSKSQHQSDQFSPETETFPDRALQLSDCVVVGNCGVGQEQTAPCPLPTPPPSPPSRGRQKRRYRRRSPLSDSSSCSSSSSSSSSSSASRSPKRQKLRCRRSDSNSSSSSCSRSISHSPPRRNRLSYSRLRCSSRSRSRSCSPSRSRSPSPRICRRRWRDAYSSSRESRRLRREHEMRIQKLKAIDERRVVYVGRICRSMTHDELRERFSQFGEVECVSLHFRDRGDHYAFVTFYNMEDAFAAIDNGGKLRKPDELPFDICFGGRRQFCNSDYSDLDANRDAEPSPAKSRYEDLDFDSLLKQAQRGLKR
ncbi:hypothetical protein Q5P01_026248 [Channa striata]|uniref:RRM domain-containing protein n=1 Tax=Channa striata TaxID=64152 RepID=A0AA88IKZ5_CHASR|nr:hypothetical protein Q5P01_026248 [Channa striata]